MGFLNAYLSSGLGCSHVWANESLQMEVPAQHYRRSRRGYNRRPAAWEYPIGLQVRQLQSQGCLYHGGRYYFVCEAPAGEVVGIEELEDKQLGNATSRVRRVPRSRG